MVHQESNNTQADLADLRGARFVMTSETEEGQRLAQGKLKRITQGIGEIKAVRKYEELQAEVVEVAFRRRVGAEFVDDRSEIGQRADRGQLRCIWPGESGGVATRGATQSLLRAAARHHHGIGGRATDPKHSRAKEYPADRHRASAPKRHTTPGWNPAAIARRLGSFLPPPRRRFLLTFTNPVTVAFDQRHVGVVQQAIQQSDDTGRVGKDFVPLFEWSIGREDHRFSFVTPVDDLVE